MSETVADLASQSFHGVPTHCSPHRLNPQAEALDRLNPPEGGEQLTALDNPSRRSTGRDSRGEAGRTVLAASRPQQLAASMTRGHNGCLRQ